MSKSKGSKGFFETLASWFGRGSKKDKTDKKRLNPETDPPAAECTPATDPPAKKWQSRSLRVTRGPPPGLSPGSGAHNSGPPVARRRSHRDDVDEPVFDHHEQFNERSVDEPRRSRDLPGGAGTRDHHAASPAAASATPAAAGAASREPSRKREISYGVSRANPDYVLEKGVDFVAAGGDVRLTFTENVDHASPLLVFCKHDVRLNGDIDDALNRNRGGKDVLLIVVTEDKDLRLPDNASVRAFGQKVCLYWDPTKRKFRYSENYDSMVWIRDFLESFRVEVNIQFTRTASYRRSFRAASTKGNVKGYYHVLTPSLEKEAVMNAILHFHEEHVELQRAPRDQSLPRPLVVFCQAEEGVESSVADFMYRNRLDKKDLVAVVFCPISHLDVYGHAPGMPSFLRLRMHDVRPRLSEKGVAENRTVATTVKNFIKKNSRAKDSSSGHCLEADKNSRSKDSSSGLSLEADRNSRSKDSSSGLSLEANRNSRSKDSSSGQGLEAGKANLSLQRDAHAPPSRGRDVPAIRGRSIEV